MSTAHSNQSTRPIAAGRRSLRVREILAVALLLGIPTVLILFGQHEASRASARKVDPEKRGEYLVTIAGCHDCHTPFIMGANGLEPDTSRTLSGHPEELEMPASPLTVEGAWAWAGAAANTAFIGPWGVSYATNLTPDENTGIGTWSEGIFIQTMRTGRHWGVARPILPPMPWQNYAAMTHEDLKSIYFYLRTIAPIQNRAPESQPAWG